MDWKKASDIQKEIQSLIKKLELVHIDAKKLICFRSFGSKSRARARIWGFPRVWQKALNLKPHYIIEVLSEKFDKLKENEKRKILIHELLHIPKNFSGSLLPHRGRGGRTIGREVEKMFKKFQNSKVKAQNLSIFHCHSKLDLESIR